MSILLDNDIALKACRYGAVEEMLSLVGTRRRAGMLGSARFVLTTRLSRRRGAAHPENALDSLRKLLKAVEMLEPEETEILLAAEMEDAAQQAGLPLDGGESQLVAMMLRRAGAAVLTGDKRAIEALEGVLDALGWLKEGAGRLACFEQMIASLATSLGTGILRAKICADEAADKAMAVCFACHAAECRDDDVAAGLASYLADVRSRAPTLLVAGADLSGLLT